MMTPTNSRPPNRATIPTPRRIQSHRDLLVWQKGMEYVDFVYDAAEAFPSRENFGLWSQVTRAAVSVPTNITEGHARSTRKEFAYFLTLARSSLLETGTLMEVAQRRRYIEKSCATAALKRIEELSKMLMSLHRKILSQQRKA